MIHVIYIYIYDTYDTYVQMGWVEGNIIPGNQRFCKQMWRFAAICVFNMFLEICEIHR